MIGAAKRRHRVAFYEPQDGVENAFGELELEQMPLRHRTCGELIHLRGSHDVEADRQAERQRIKLRIRRTGAAKEIKAGWRCQHVTLGTVWKVIDADAVTQRGLVYLILEGPVV